MIEPVIDEPARQAVFDAAAEARSAGTRIVTGAAIPEGDGYFVLPTVLDHVHPGARLLQEELGQ